MKQQMESFISGSRLDMQLFLLTEVFIAEWQLKEQQ